MRFWALAAAGFGLLVLATASQPSVAANATRIEGQAPIVVAQNEPKKKETVTQKVKRKVKTAWRNLAGYKFDVGCPVILPVTRSSCTQTGKSREDARAKCQSANPICSVSDAR